MVRLTVDYNNNAGVWFVKTSDLLGVHAEGETLEQLCGKLTNVVNDLIECNRSKKPGTLYCSFCGKSQHQVKQLIAGPGNFVCDECVGLMQEILEGKTDEPAIKQGREIKLEELRQLRADVARLHDSLARIEEKINEPPFWMVEEQ